MSPLSTKYMERGCNLHSPSMVRCTFRNVALLFLVCICVSYIQYAVALQPYRHSVAVLDAHEDIDNFLLVETHDKEEASPSFSPTRYVASPSGYIDDTYARLLWGRADAQQPGFARAISSALFEEGSMSQSSTIPDTCGVHEVEATSADGYLCNVIEQLNAKGPLSAIFSRAPFTLVYPEHTAFTDTKTPNLHVVIFQKIQADGRETVYPAKRQYSYSFVTGITHASLYTQVIMDIVRFHRDFVKAYMRDKRPVSEKGSVKDILFSLPIKLSVETGRDKSFKTVKVERSTGKPFTFKVDALGPAIAMDAKESTKRLELIQKYFNDVTSACYDSRCADFNSGPGIPDRVKTELAKVTRDSVDNAVKDNASDDETKCAAKCKKESGNEFNIRADYGYYGVHKDERKPEYRYYKVGLDEIHRCMHQGINLVRAFCNPYTGAINAGDFTKSTAFATDYMRIPTGQTILDYKIVVDEAKKKGTVLVSTHISTTKMTSKSFTLNGFDITFQKFDYTKSPQFHVARTLAAFEWPADVSPVVEYIFEELNKFPNSVSRSDLKTALDAPFVYDRMNGYLEELTSVARTVNPETIVKKLVEAVAVENTATEQKTVTELIYEVFSRQLLYPLGTNHPRKKIVERVAEGVTDIVALVFLNYDPNTKQRIVALLFNWMRERVNAAFDFERQKKIFDENFADIPRIEPSRKQARSKDEGATRTASPGVIVR